MDKSNIKNYFLQTLKYAFRVFFVLLLLIMCLIAYVWINEVPSEESLKNPDIKLASTLLDTNGKFIGVYQSEYRSVITFEQINPMVIECLLAVEDTRFFEHNGIDFRALARVGLRTLLMGEKSSGGGSTITQQLAKQLYPRPSMKNQNFFGRVFLLVKSKMKEWIIALKLEKIYSKETILTMYLNKFEFINRAHGIDAAALTYFGKNQNKLTLDEAATLVGMLKNPSLYNPVRFPELVHKRRNEVLTKVEEQNKKVLTGIKSIKTSLSKFKRYANYDTIVPYFKNSLEKHLASLIREYNLKKSDGNYYDIYSDGLTIESTIDLDMQQLAEKATLEHMAWIQKWWGYDWKHRDPWTFMAGEDEKMMRMASLEEKAKASQRYSILKKKYLHSVMVESGEFFTEQELKYLKDQKNIKNSNLQIDAEKQKYLKTLKNNKKADKILKAYDALQQAYKKEFDSKFKMKIFDHQQGQRSVIMTPMDSVRYHARLLQTGLIAIDPRNGHVKCWNGGLDYNYFKYDHVLSRRSVGSTLKPFLYTVAMAQKGIKPCQEYQDISYTILPCEGDFKNKEPWKPENATKINTTLNYNLYHGLLYSKNSITVKLLKEIGSVEPLRDLLDKMGIDKNEILSNGRLAVPQLPSISLGAVDITLLQLTAAYATYANNGIFTQPVLVKSIKDKTGKILYEAKKKTNKAIDPLYNSIMLDMLINNESGQFSMHLKSQNGGKTGTTDDQSDGWFVGLTPELVVGVWTGGDDKWIRFIREDVGQGYFTARPVFEKFIRKLENDKSGIYDVKARFTDPPPGFQELTNCKKVKTELLPEFLRPKKLPEDSIRNIKIVSDSLVVN
jgi:penicillin-binding protein 1A